MNHLLRILLIFIIVISIAIFLNYLWKKSSEFSENTHKEKMLRDYEDSLMRSVSEGYPLQPVWGGWEGDYEKRANALYRKYSAKSKNKK